MTDRKKARENVGYSFKLVGDLNKRKYRAAENDITKIRKNLRSINHEIRSGKAQKEKSTKSTYKETVPN